jgi:predicted ribosome quality control (RQC) complex YloA/Tae2 family protein
MDNFFLAALLAEIRPILTGKSLAKISLAETSLLLDFHLPNRLILRASFDTALPALFLENTQKEKLNDAHPFLSTLRKELEGAKLIAISKPPLDRIVKFDFETFTIAGDKTIASLIFAFTGRTTNAYLTDANGYIEASLNTRGSNTQRVSDYFEIDATPFVAEDLLKDLPATATQEEISERFFKSKKFFSPFLEKEFAARCHSLKPSQAFATLLQDLTQAPSIPVIYSALPMEEIGSRAFNIKTDLLLSHFPLRQAQANHLQEHQAATLSAAAARYFQARKRAKRYQDKHDSLRRLLTDEVKKRAALLAAIEADKTKFADPERFKQLGDLLLANLRTARISDNKATVIDYYDSSQPEIEIELGEGKSLQQASTDYFTQFQKARRALEAIAARETVLKPKLESLRDLLKQFDEDLPIQRLDEIRLRVEKILDIKPKPKSSAAKKPASKKPVGRWFVSPTGFEIVVGKNDRDNDAITFRIAGSQDVWMHAADYPGSHVVIRNPNRQEIPNKVIQEAAELAAFYSQAKEQKKVAVHYTAKKFITKPPRSKPGLVRLSFFKTILVEPRNSLQRIEK